MTIREALKQATERLVRAGVPDAKLDAQLMLAFLMKEERLSMRLNDGREAPPTVLAQFAEAVLRRSMREPLQYILGETEFMGLTFHVEPGVLIPRMDTEILCEEVIRRIGHRALRVLDIGTGSGAIAISIASLCPNCSVTAVDISEKALSIAQENARRLGASVRFLRSDCMDALPEAERFDMIVSNPPYISDAEMETLMPEVLREPEIALRGGADGLDFYRRIAREAPARLNDGGQLIFEIGWLEKDEVMAIIRESVGEPFAMKDYGDNWRVVGAVKE